MLFTFALLSIYKDSRSLEVTKHSSSNAVKRHNRMVCCINICSKSDICALYIVNLTTTIQTAASEVDAV